MFDFKSLKLKILFILLIPTLSMFYFSSKFMYENYYSQKNAIKTNKQITTIKYISELIHELQKERGLNAAYLGKETLETKKQLIAQQNNTDKAIKDYTEYYKSLNHKVQFPISIIEQLKNIKLYRIKLLSKQVTFYNEIEFYSEIIKQLISSMPIKTYNYSNTKILNEFEAIQNLIYFKEYAGIERAYLSNIFEEDKCDIKQLKDIQRLYIQQNIYYQNFIRYTPKEIYLQYTNSISIKLQLQLKLFRSLVLNSNKTDKFGIDGLVWYKLATERIDKINNTLNILLNKITKELSQNKEEASKALFYSILFWILSILAFIFIWYIVYQLINIEETNIKKLEHQQKSYSAISNITNSITYIENANALYHNLCKTLLDIDGFYASWVGVIDKKQKSIIPVVAENIKLHKLEKLDFSFDNIQMSNTRLTTPQKTYLLDKYVLSEDIDIKNILTKCYGVVDDNTLSIASFPIYVNKEIVSIITIFSYSKNAFDIDTIELIEKLLKDTSLSLEFIRIRDNEKKMLEELYIASYAFESQEAMTITDVNAKIIKVNKAFEKITGYTEDEVLGKNPSILRSDKQSSEFYTSMWKDLKEKGSWKGEIYNKRKNGEIYPEMLSITSIKNDKGEITHYIAQFLDISDIKNLQKDAEFRAEHDPLTSLTNRAKLKQETQKVFIYGKEHHIQHAFFFLDIDNFKYINDFYGHTTGDEILKEIAYRLKRCINKDDIVSRLGGDEFAILSINIGNEEIHSLQQATQIAKMIQKNMKEPIIIDGHPFEITFSIGIKIFPNHENGYEEVISHADIAMYKAKKSGKNQFAFFDTELDIELKQFSLLEKEIKKALINKEFVLHYQPKIDIMTNKMIGMEALARWSHPKKGLLSPNEFLQVVADTRNMYILETLLIEQIFAQISKWKQQYQKFDYIIAINITPESFQNDKFIPFLQNCISKYNIDASILELELVENTFVTDMQQAISKIQILKSIGIKFAIDDFGTGYSSLTYLQKLPIDSIKIDKSFIMDIDDQSNKEIVKMIINFAKLFNLKVVAEGVENIKTLNFLVDLKCDYYQGYFYSRAISAKEIEKFL